MLEHVRTHHQVRVPVAAGVGAVRADAADLGGEVEDELGLGIEEQPLDVVVAREVVVGPAGDEHLLAFGFEPLDEMRAKKASAAGDQDLHAAGKVDSTGAVQSTRPSHRSRFSAYQAIVRAIPSSHVTFGCHPVSRCSFSNPTRSAITSLAPGR